MKDKDARNDRPPSPYHLLHQWETNQREAARTTLIDTPTVVSPSVNDNQSDDEVFFEEGSIHSPWHQRRRFTQILSADSQWGQIPSDGYWDHDPSCYEFSPNTTHHRSSTDPHLLDGNSTQDQTIRARSSSASDILDSRKQRLTRHRAFSFPLNPESNPRYNEPWVTPDSSPPP